MKKNILSKIGIITMVTLASMLFSCKKLFDVPPKSVVDVTNNYQNVYDANSAVLGVYGKLLGIAEQYIVLNELRADLMDITPNSDKNLIEISQHNVSANNPWANPRPMFNIIINCNDILSNFDKMLASNKITTDDYNQRYADVACLRAWVYLQLGIHYGTVPYVTDPISDINALKDQTLYPRLTFSQLLDKLISTIAPLPYLDPYTAASGLTSGASSSLVTTIDGYSTHFFFINKQYLLGDLYLWQGNYTLAATSYRAALEYLYVSTGSTANLNWKILRVSGQLSAVGYARSQDVNSLIASNTSGWQSLFARNKSQDASFNSGAPFEAEWMWQMVFDSSFQPQDPFVDLFANQGGHWLVQPSQTAIGYWNSQTQFNGIPYDERGRETYHTINGQNVIMKNLYVYQDATITHKYGKWFLMRASGCHLHFAEAANRDGRSKLAFAFLNYGIINVFDHDLPTFTSPNTTNKDVTNNQQTFDTPPYDFDARNGRSPYPFFNADWSQNVGIRNNAYVTPYPASAYADVQGLEDKIILEDALELAYEGDRWPDLLRIALRRNDPSFIANKVYDKLSKDGYPAQAAAAQAKLMSGNYYLPFNW